MEVKIDKEVLAKHHFWILAGVFLILILIPLLLLATSVGASVAEAEKKLEDSKKSLQQLNNPKNDKWVAAYTKQDGYVEAKKNQVWQQTWETQKDMMTWPPGLQNKFSAKYQYMGDKFNEFDADEYRREYRDQLAEVYWTADPVTSSGEGAVQFNGGFDNVLHLERKFDAQQIPDRDDIWLAQEDLWVKRELMRIIRATNDSVARFTEVSPPAPASEKPKAEPKPQPPAEKGEATASAEAEKPAPKPKPRPKPAAPRTDPNHRVFRNPFWELDLTLARPKGKSYVLRGTVKNVSPRRQPLGISFRVYLSDFESEPAILPVDAPPLAVGDKAEIKDVPVADGLNVRELFGVEQVLTWRTAAVKRIDSVWLGYNSSRTAGKTLKRPRWLATDQATADVQPATQSQTPPPEASASKTMSMMGMMGGGRSGGDGSTTKNGLILDRYTYAGEQVRQMPVGMVVILDEDRIPEFLGAFANSKLRIQTLQTHWAHTREKIRPAPTESSESGDRTKPGSAGGMGGEFPMMPGANPGYNRMRAQMGTMMSGMMSGMKGMMMSGRGDMMAGKGGARTQAQLQGAGALGGTFGANPSGGEDEEEAEMNLVELATYGVASLYERYPPKPPEQASASGQPTK
jgi:hypothetical protein